MITSLLPGIRNCPPTSFNIFLISNFLEPRVDFALSVTPGSLVHPRREQPGQGCLLLPVDRGERALADVDPLRLGLHGQVVHGCPLDRAGWYP